MFDSVSAISLAARASIVVNVVLVITFLTSIKNTITAPSVSAVGSASIGLGVAQVSSGIALFAAEVVDNTVTAEVQLAVATASIGSGVAVTVVGSSGEFNRVSVIASFVEVGINLSVTASEGAVSEAQPGINTAGVTVFSEVNDVITARCWAARCHGVPWATEGVGRV